jgi:integrase
VWQKLYPPGTRRGNDRYIARGRDKWGDQYEVILPTTKPRIAAKLAEQYQDKRNSCPPAPEPAPVAAPAEARTFRLAAERYLEWRRPTKVEEKRLAKLVAAPLPDDLGGGTLGDRLTAEVGQDELVAVARMLWQGGKPSTLNREALRPYAAVLHYAEALTWRAPITLRSFVEDEPEREPAEAADLALVLANVERAYPAQWGIKVDRRVDYKRALLMLLWERGLRLADNLRLRRDEDLDLKGGRIRVKIGKARGRVKWLPISPELVALFANLKPCDGVYLFPWRSRSGVYKWLKPVVRGLKKQRPDLQFTPHMARHAFATEMLEAGVDAKVVQDGGGWSSYESVRRTYQHVREATLREADERRKATGAKE